MEQDQRVLEQLAALSSDEIRKELSAVRRERERLETAEQALQSILELVVMSEPRTRTIEVPLPSLDGEVEDGAVVEAKTAGSKRAAIVAVMAGDPARIWRSKEVHEALLAQGVVMTPENLRVTMRRMSKAGVLSKPSQGRFRLPRPSAEAQS